MEFADYLRDCLKNLEFKSYWEEEIGGYEDQFPFDLKVDSVDELSIREALELLTEADLNKIIPERGIHPDAQKKIAGTEISFFEFEDTGECPVADFLSNISDQKLKVETLSSIAELSVRGNLAKLPLSRYIDEGIFELRTRQSNNIDRLFYFFIFGNKIILTNGYIKKSQKLDRQEFELAKKYRDIYMKRFK